MRRVPHLLIGAACGLGLGAVTHNHSELLVGAAALAAVVPDLDLQFANRRALPPRPGARCGLFEHRGPTHSILAANLLAWLVITLSGQPPLGLAVGIGYLSHLVADGISYMGVPYLWPLTAQRFRLLPYGTRIASGNSWIELPLALACVVGAFLVSR